VAFSADGRLVLGQGSERQTVIAWDVGTGEAIADPGDVGPARASPLSPDGRWFAHIDGNTIRLIDFELDQSERLHRLLCTRLDPTWHAAEATRQAKAGQWFAAAFHCRWTLATAPAADGWRRLALCQLAAGQLDAYRGSCTELLALYEPAVGAGGVARMIAAAPAGWPPAMAVGLMSPPAGDVSRVVRVCLLRPRAPADAERLLRLVPAHDAVTRGAVLCRAGKHDLAAALLRGRPEALALLYLALAECGRDRRPEAQKALDRVVGWLPQPGGLLLPWEDRLELELLIQEIRAVLAPARP
jgi:hypothetical protein